MGLYLGSVLFSTFATMAFGLKADATYKMECAKNGYINKNKKDLLKEFDKEYSDFIIQMLIPIYNITVAIEALSADVEKNVQETIKKQLETGELVKIDETLNSNETTANQTISTPNKSYDDMTIAEKLNFLDIEKQKLVNLSSSYNQVDNKSTNTFEEKTPVYLKK